MTWVPPDVRVADHERDEPRLGALLGRAVTGHSPAWVSIIGLADAAGAPRAVRERLYALYPDPEQADAFGELLRNSRDLGDIALGDDVEGARDELAATIGRELSSGAFVIVLGASPLAREAHFLGYVQASIDVAIQALSAAPGLCAGSALHDALGQPEGKLKHLRIDALQPARVGARQADFLRRHDASLRFRHQFHASTLFAPRGGRVLASFSVDALDAAHAPGVAQPTCDGLTIREWLEAAERAGAAPSVCSLDCVGLATERDATGQTAAVAAQTIWHALRGLCRRRRLR